MLVGSIILYDQIPTLAEYMLTALNVASMAVHLTEQNISM